MGVPENKWLRWLITAFLAVCWAYAYSARFTGFIGAARTEKIFLFATSLIAFATLLFVLLSPLLTSLIRFIHFKYLLRFVILSMIMAASILSLFSQPPPFPEDHTLKISTRASDNSIPTRKPVRILSINRVYQPDGERIQIDPSELELAGEWQQLADNSLLLDDDNPGSILFNDFMQAGIEVVLQTGPGQGIVQLNWDGKEQIIDLRSDQTQSVTEHLFPARNLAEADSVRKLLVVSAIIAEFFALTSLLLITLIVIFSFLNRLVVIRNPGLFSASFAVLILLLVLSIHIEQPVHFEDQGLGDAVRAALGKPDEVIFQHQLQTIAILDASNRDISNLDGIQHLSNLVDLNLRDNHIVDLTPLNQLNKLKSLNLRGNNIVNIEPLSQLANLEYLNLHSNSGIRTISPLAHLIHLKTLILRNVSVNDEIDILSNLTKLQHINLRNTGISDTGIIGRLMENGALQDNPQAGDRAEVDIRGNPLDINTFDSYASLRPYWENISSRVPYVLPYYAILEPPKFSRQAGFYTDGFLLELSANEPNTSIHYTLDGSEPTRESPIYTTPIPIDSLRGEPSPLADIASQLASPDQLSDFENNPYREGPVDEVFKANVVRARVFHNQRNESSPTITNTYFVDEDIYDRYGLPVISLSTNAGYFFDYKDGIYVMGEFFDRFYDPELKNPLHQQANYHQRGMEWERPVNIEFFEPGGKTGFSQGGAVRIHGGQTRGYPQKSLRFYARSEYGSEESINYELFPGLQNRIENQPILQFDNLLLLNSGNDWTSTLFRDALMQSLVSHTSLDIMAFRPVVVFLNGEYWGIYNLRQRLDEYYLASKYQLDPDKVVILRYYHDLFRGNLEDKDHYRSMLKFIGENDMKDPRNYEYIQTLMDTDNFIDYLASEIYFANTDWPLNNIRYWRYKTEAYDPEALPGQDGRWRWMLFDTDAGFGLLDKNGLYDHNTLELAEDPVTSIGYIFSALLGNQAFKFQFINSLADHLNTSFEEQRVLDSINQMQVELQPQMDEQIRRWRTMDDSIEVWEGNVENLRAFARIRPDIVRQQIIERFGLPGTATLTLKSDPEKGYVQINSIPITADTPGVNDPGDWSGVYFMDVPVQITAIPEPGYQFDGWEGTEQDQARIVLNLKEDLTLRPIFTTLP